MPTDHVSRGKAATTKAESSVAPRESTTRRAPNAATKSLIQAMERTTVNNKAEQQDARDELARTPNRRLETSRQEAKRGPKPDRVTAGLIEAMNRDRPVKSGRKTKGSAKPDATDVSLVDAMKQTTANSMALMQAVLGSEGSSQESQGGPKPDQATMDLIAAMNSRRRG
jgi:hypothetical protein